MINMVETSCFAQSLATFVRPILGRFRSPLNLTVLESEIFVADVSYVYYYYSGCTAHLFLFLIILHTLNLRGRL
jgi:hypothetical protein